MVVVVVIGCSFEFCGYGVAKEDAEDSVLNRIAF